LNSDLPNYGESTVIDEVPVHATAEDSNIETTADPTDNDHPDPGAVEWDYEPKYFTPEDLTLDSPVLDRSSNEPEPRYHLRRTTQRSTPLEHYGLLSTYSIQKAL